MSPNSEGIEPSLLAAPYEPRVGQIVWRRDSWCDIIDGLAETVEAFRLLFHGFANGLTNQPDSDGRPISFSDISPNQTSARTPYRLHMFEHAESRRVVRAGDSVSIFRPRLGELVDGARSILAVGPTNWNPSAMSDH